MIIIINNNKLKRMDCNKKMKRIKIIQNILIKTIIQKKNYSKKKKKKISLIKKNMKI